MRDEETRSQQWTFKLVERIVFLPKEMSYVAFSGRSNPLVVTLLSRALAAFIYLPAVLLGIHKAGYIEKGQIGNVIVEFGESWVPLLSNKSWPGKTLAFSFPQRRDWNRIS